MDSQSGDSILISSKITMIHQLNIETRKILQLSAVTSLFIRFQCFPQNKLSWVFPLIHRIRKKRSAEVLIEFFKQYKSPKSSTKLEVFQFFDNGLTRVSIILSPLEWQNLHFFMKNWANPYGAFCVKLCCFFKRAHLSPQTATDWKKLSRNSKNSKSNSIVEHEYKQTTTVEKRICRF